jgi:hypothetical protein
LHFGRRHLADDPAAFTGQPRRVFFFLFQSKFRVVGCARARAQNFFLFSNFTHSRHDTHTITVRMGAATLPLFHSPFIHRILSSRLLYSLWALTALQNNQ